MARILIVDDDADMRTLLGFCFRRRGHSVEVACDGAEALVCIASQAPDLVVTDVNMPGVNGLELLRRLRAEGLRHLPTIVLTAQADHRAGAMAAGADAFVVKPVSLRELGELAEQLLAPPLKTLG